MLPKGRLGRQLRSKLKVYAGDKHPHESQKPEVLTIDGPIPVHLTPDPKPKARVKKVREAGDKKKSEPAKKATAKRSTARGEGEAAAGKKKES
jgi:hypothetical protein